MGPSRRNINGRSPLVNQQRQITSFFTKSTSSPSPILSISNSNHKPNPNPNPSNSPATPSQPHKPLLLIGASPSPSPSPPPPSTDVVGRRVKVYWPLDKAWYEGSVKSFDKITSKHLVRYDDGEQEALDLSKEKIEWPQLRHQHCEGKKKLKRLRKMVIEDDKVEEIHKHDDEPVDVVVDDDDSSDEDWVKNVMVEDDDGECEEDMELEEEEEEEDVAKRSKRKPSEKVELRKRKLGGTEKLKPLKKSKSAGEVQVNKGGFKLSVLEPNNISNLESK